MNVQDAIIVILIVSVIVSILKILSLKTALGYSEERYNLCNKQRCGSKTRMMELEEQLHKEARCSTTAVNKNIYTVALTLITFESGRMQTKVWSDTVLAVDAVTALGIMLAVDEYKKQTENNKWGLYGWNASLVKEEDHNAAGYFRTMEEKKDG